MKRILFFLILVAAGAALAALLAGYDKEAEAPSSEVNSKDRKTYRFSGHPFEFDYPEDWAVREVELGVAVLTEGPNAAPNGGSISIDVTGELPYERALGEIKSDLTTSTSKNINVASLSGAQISGILGSGLEEGSGKYATFTMLDYGGRLISIDYVGAEEGASVIRDAYDDIVRSFRLVPYHNL